MNEHDKKINRILSKKSITEDEIYTVLMDIAKYNDNKVDGELTEMIVKSFIISFENYSRIGDKCKQNGVKEFYYNYGAICQFMYYESNELNQITGSIFNKYCSKFDVSEENEVVLIYLLEEDYGVHVNWNQSENYKSDKLDKHCIKVADYYLYENNDLIFKNRYFPFFDKGYDKKVIQPQIHKEICARRKNNKKKQLEWIQRRDRLGSNQDDRWDIYDDAEDYFD